MLVRDAGIAMTGIVMYEFEILNVLLKRGICWLDERTVGMQEGSGVDREVAFAWNTDVRVLGAFVMDALHSLGIYRI